MHFSSLLNKSDFRISLTREFKFRSSLEIPRFFASSSINIDLSKFGLYFDHLTLLVESPGSAFFAKLAQKFIIFFETNLLEGDLG